LQDDPGDRLDAFGQLGHVGGRRAQQDDAQEQDDEVDQVQVERAAVDEVEGDVGHAERADQQAEDAAVVQLGGEGAFLQHVFGRIGRVGVAVDGRIHFDDFLALLRMQPGVQQRQRHDDHQAGDQHRHREDGFRQRDDAHLLGGRMARGGHQHGDAGRQAQAVHGETAVGRGDDQRVVHALDLQRQLLGDDAADDQAEAPVQVAADAAHQRGDDDGGVRLVHVADDAVEQAVGQWRGGQHVAHGQDHGHLGGEGQQAPEALAPGAGHVADALAFDAHGQQHGEQGQRDREDKGIGQILAHQLSEKRCQFIHGASYELR